MEFVAPEEIALSVHAIVTRSYGMPRDDVFGPTARLLGFKRVTEDMRIRIDAVLAEMFRDGQLVERGGLLLIPGN
jgi:hypothetical protein